MIADGDADARTLARRVEMLGCSQRPRERLRGRFHGFFALRHAEPGEMEWTHPQFIGLRALPKIDQDRNGYACWWLSVCRACTLVNFLKNKK
jgi:hypothetical protein